MNRRQCSFCGHLRHADACPSRIQTSPKTTADCPCIHRAIPEAAGADLVAHPPDPDPTPTPTPAEPAAGVFRSREDQP